METDWIKSCLNLKSSLAARLGSASAKLEKAGRLILLICFDPFYRRRIFPDLLTRFRRVKRLWQSTAKFDLRFYLDWIWSWFWIDLISSGDLIGQRLTITDPQRSCRVELAAELEETSGEVKESSSAELDNICGEATEHPSAWLHVTLSEVNSAES